MKGWLAEFDSPEGLLDAARTAQARGYAPQAFSPFPVEGLDEALGLQRSPIAACTFAGALLGGCGGYAMQYFAAVVDRPLNIGGRPLHSWPMFVPVSFELAVLGGALAAVMAFLWTSRLPRLRQPIFDAPHFGLATRDRFFLLLPAEDPAFEPESAAQWLDQLRPLRRVELPG
ncbi:DUF3341 domain-containing protein [Paucibacter sp. R3-3]|uniref:DUF3341 domain-containing protein n=1 Tax=Roseateles agri TaxID=3098619 RepID=A0ABU5DN15_9BURK|nr:DUF3341 domain-containing protein [Paucibacter sp. R3-3]MDY0747713.1 DUF3341 domain-containing protein [Paucibacter sp. R3-3]